MAKEDGFMFISLFLCNIHEEEYVRCVCMCKEYDSKVVHHQPD